MNSEHEILLLRYRASKIHPGMVFGSLDKEELMLAGDIVTLQMSVFNVTLIPLGRLEEVKRRAIGVKEGVLVG